MAEFIPQTFDDTTEDLLYAIILKLGGSMADVEQLYRDTGDDLLYAILKLIGGGGNPPSGPGIGSLPDPNEFLIGTAAAIAYGALVDGTVVTNVKLQGRNVAIFRNNIILPGIDPLDGGAFFTKIKANNSLTLSHALKAGELLKIVYL